MHFHLIFECKFALLCEGFLYIFCSILIVFWMIFHQILGRGGTSEASGATSWQPGGSKSDFLMNFGGSRASFWSPGGTLGGVMGPLVDPKCLQDASPKRQNLKKNDLGNDVEQKSSTNAVPDVFFLFYFFLIFCVWCLSAFLKRWVRTFGINMQKQNIHFLLVFTMF